jgi:MFS family permease
MRSRLARVDRTLLAIVAEGFFSRLSFGLITFALPLYAYRELGMSLSEVGLLASLNMIVAIALKPVMGSLADRFGFKRSLSFSMALRSAVTLLLAFAAVPWHLYAARTVHGVSISIRDPAVGSLIAEHGGKNAVASAFAWYQTAKSLAGAGGKVLAGVLLSLTADFSLIFLIAFGLSALPIFVVARYVREVEPVPEGVETEIAPQAEEEAEEAAEPPGQGPRSARVASFATLGFLTSGTAYMLTPLFPVFAVEYAGLTEAQAGLIYAASALVVLAGPGFGWLSDNVSRGLVLSIRSAANVLSSVVYWVAPSFAGMAAGRALDDLGKAAFRPAWGALMAQVSGLDRRRRGRTIGYLSAGEDAGEAAGPIVAGFLWSTWGVPVLLAARIVLAIVTELYTVFLTRSHGERERRESTAPVPRVSGFDRELELALDVLRAADAQHTKR